MPEFIPRELWPPNANDLKPVYYSVVEGALNTLCDLDDMKHSQTRIERSKLSSSPFPQRTGITPDAFTTHRACVIATSNFRHGRWSMRSVGRGGVPRCPNDVIMRHSDGVCSRRVATSSCTEVIGVTAPRPDSR